MQKSMFPNALYQIQADLIPHPERSCLSRLQNEMSYGMTHTEYNNGPADMSLSKSL